MGNVDKFFEIKEQMKRQKDKENYDRWMKEVTPYIDTLEPYLKCFVEKKYNGNFNRMDYAFEIKQKKIVELITDFANATLTNETLRKRYLDNLHNRNPNLIATIKTDPLPQNLSEEKKREWGSSAVGRVGRDEVNRVDIKKEDVGKVHMIVRLGQKQSNGKLVASIGNVTSYVHELAHTVSERNLSQEPMEIKQDCVGEIESLVMENLFMSYLEKNRERLASLFSKEGIIPSADTRLIDSVIRNYYIEHDKGLADKIDMIKNEEYNPSDPLHKQHEFRYFIGDIYAYLLKEMYETNPQKAINQYAKFLECNASLSLEDCSKVLFGNKNMTIKNVVEKFMESLDKKTQKIEENQEERCM